MNNAIRIWNDRAIRIRDDRYVSLTDMAQACGKKLGHWNENKATKSYLEALSRSVDIPIDQLIQINESKGGNETRGTWGHPKAAIRFAQWCSDEFAVQVDSWIDELFTVGAVSIAPQQPDRPVLGAYIERVKTMHDNARSIPEGYWCVLHEASGLLVYVESVLKLPVDKADLLDGSIGRTWSEYRKGKDWCGSVKKFSYQFPDGRWCNPLCYEYKELEQFRLWLDRAYKKDLMPRYLENKYGAIARSRV